MRQMQIQGAIFDMDGTLLNSMPVWHGLIEQWIGRYGITLDAEDHEQLEGGGQQYCIQYFIKKHPDRLQVSVQQLMQEMDELACTRYRQMAQLRAGALDFLTQLKKDHVKIAVATLTSRKQAEIALRHVGIDGLIDILLTCEEVGANKRQPQIYCRAAEQFGLAPSVCCVFEDTPYAAETAKKAGFQVCGMREASYAAGEELLRSVSDFFVEQSFAELTTGGFK